MKLSHWALLAAPLAAAACGSFAKAMTTHTDVVAKAAGHELKVDEAASLLAGNPQIPAEPQTVRTLADLWVDYTLLATAAAEDTSLAALNLDQLVQRQKEEVLLSRYLDTAIRPDTVLSEAQLQQKWQEQGPGVEVHARHILLQVPSDATPAQRDSVHKLAEQLRAQAASGADFAALAKQYSQDPGSAQQGGDLGFFGRGRMVAPFEKAAFELQPGQISPVVETPFGYHIIKVEGRRQQEMGPQKEQFRQFVTQQAKQEAASKYFDSLTTAANIEVKPGAEQLVKELAGQEDLTLRGRAADRTLVTYKGGELTAGELMADLRNNPAQMRQSVASAPEEQLKEFLKQQALREVVVAEAKKHTTLSPATTDSIRTGARHAIHELLRSTGLNPQRTGKGAAASAAVETEVKNLLQKAIAGEQQLPNLGPLGTALRDDYPGAEVNTGSFAQVVEKMKAIRATQPAPPAPSAGGAQAPVGAGHPPVGSGVSPHGAPPAQPDSGR